ncbi:hypothetical protein L9F63_012827, partial [Diploptera punctata]
SKKKTAKKRHNTGRPEATDDGDKLPNCSLEEKGYEFGNSSIDQKIVLPGRKRETRVKLNQFPLSAIRVLNLRKEPK